jgi:hypothetical protein
VETSILTSTKKNLGLAEDYTVFDQDIITYINSAFSTLTSLGVGPASGFMIQDASTEWVEFIGNDNSAQSGKDVYLPQVEDVV